jgi:CheY-like chemotaxis protein
MTKRILIVDDEKVFSDYLRQILSRKGFESAVAHNGEEALALCERSTYDLILTDIKMPKMDGLELLKRLTRETWRSSWQRRSGGDGGHLDDRARQY